MRKFSRIGAVALFSLIFAGLLVACGDSTATAIPAKTDAAMAKTTGAAMAQSTDAMAKPTEAAMAMTTQAAMAKGTEGAMMQPTGAAMSKGTDAAMTTQAAMAMTTGAAMAQGTEGAMMKDSGPLSGDFNNQGAEPVSGKATLGKTSDGKLVLRFENLKSANGPDLYVYLTKDAAPTTADQIKAGFEVGKLKATEGNLNYELDSKLDISQYKSAVIYCKSFSAIFGYASLKMGVA